MILSGPITITDAQGRQATLSGDVHEIKIPASPGSVSFVDIATTLSASFKVAAFEIHNPNPTPARFDMIFTGRDAGDSDTYRNCEVINTESGPKGLTLRMVSHGPLTFKRSARKPPRIRAVSRRTLNRQQKRQRRAKIRAARWVA